MRDTANWSLIRFLGRIEAIRSDGAVLRYVTKYVVKDGDIEFKCLLSAESGNSLPSVFLYQRLKAYVDRVTYLGALE